MSNLYILPTDTCFGIACPVSDIESYKKIYEIKGRGFEKPLALVCENFEYLENNTNLNKSQIDFLKNYNKPFTVLINTNKITDKKLLQNINKLPNKNIYTKLAFRVSHTFMQVRLNQSKGILFLSSANKSRSPELFSTSDIKKQFKNEIEEYDIKVFAHGDFSINYKQKSSDIFEFTKDSIDMKYLREG